jgi:hypothetical protein
MTLAIFNRWGLQLYDATEQNPSWDGAVKGGGKAGDGTYFYFVKATGYDGEKIEKSGTVNLYR